MERKELYGNRYAVYKNMLLDTVPAAYADAWLRSAPEADTLLLCGTNPYPKTVKRFWETHPDGKIYAPHYTAYILNGILGEDVKIELVRGTKHIEDITLNVISQPGKGSYLTVDFQDGDAWSGAEDTQMAEPVKYADPTVVLCYVSDCGYTEWTAEKIAEGIRDTGGIETQLIDLASEEIRSVIPRLVNAAGLLIGTPTVDGEAAKKVWELLTAMSGELFSGKFATAFGAYTSNGDGVAHVIERMRQLKMNLIDGGYTVQYRPDEAVLKSTYEYGYYFGCKLQNKANTHRSRLMKCLVCGEIFDASLGVCPVCNVGLDKCVPVDDEVINYKEDTNRIYLIAGGGAAALSAAQAIRNRDKTGRILMICAEEFLPINRPMLTKNMVVSARVEHSIDVKPAEWFVEQEIELKLHTSVTAVDPEEKTAVLSDGTVLSYDRFICATGAECMVPPMPGDRLDGVITVRHLRDVHNIWKRLGTARKVVVIGGGVLGLEMASELKKMRLAVTVLERGKLMARQLDEETAEALTRAAEEYGISIHVEVIVTEITGEDRVTGVRLDDGTFFPADMVIISCGNRANMEVAKAAGAACGRAITVTERMETNLPDFYAAGDCAAFNGVNYQLWAEAAEQGRVAGANAVGDRVKYVTTPLGASFEGMNTKLYSIGDVGKGEKEYKIVCYHDEIEKSFRKYWFADGRLAGGILFGNTDKIPELTEALASGSSYDTLREKL